MTFELAKKLKDSGFKGWEDRENLGQSVEPDGRIRNTLLCTDKSVYHPTLSELIEACGNFLHSISRSSGIDKEGRTVKTWCAEARDPENDQILMCSDEKTIEEAVANLWLEINKK